MYKFIAEIKNKNEYFYVNLDFSLWDRTDFSTLYLVNFNKYAKFKDNEIEVDIDLLISKSEYEDRESKKLWYMLPINEKSAYCIVPYLNDEEVIDYIKNINIVVHWEMLSVEEYIIKSIIE